MSFRMPKLGISIKCPKQKLPIPSASYAASLKIGLPRSGLFEQSLEIMHGLLLLAQCGIFMPIPATAACSLVYDATVIGAHPIWALSTALTLTVLYIAALF